MLSTQIIPTICDANLSNYFFSGNGAGWFIAKSAHFTSQSYASPQGSITDRAVEQSERLAWNNAFDADQMSGNGNHIKEMSPAAGHYDPSFQRLESFTGKFSKILLLFLVARNNVFDSDQCPETETTLKKCRLPLGIIIHSFKDLSHLSVSFHKFCFCF